MVTQSLAVLSACILILIFYESVPVEAQVVLNPRQRAEKLYDDFSKLEFLTLGKWCARPDRMRDEFIEGLVEKEDLELTETRIIDSLALLNRWTLYGGYRCDPSKYVCAQKNDQKWECVCPNEHPQIGKQKVNTVNGECVFDPTSTFNPTGFFDPQSCTDVSPAAIPYDKEIICGIYVHEELKHPPAKTEMLTIESGLHFSNIKCPDGQKCLIKEFDAECNQEGIDKLTEWIAKKQFKYGEAIVKDRRPTWPPCTCSSKPVKEFPTADPNQAEMDKALGRLPKAGFGQSCDRDQLVKMETCIHSNWYLIPDHARDAYEALIKRFIDAERGRAFTVRADCDGLKGHVCRDKEGVPGDKRCLCDRVPYLPGWRPIYPDKINSEGYCLLDSGSDCLYNYPKFKCLDGEKCLLAKYDVLCTEANYALAHQDKTGHWDLDKVERYQRRCRCSANKVNNDLKVKDGSDGSNEEGGVGAKFSLDARYLVLQFTFLFRNFVISKLAGT